jgi:HTH-type transcriptional regulator, sugar sensing transcriptional regulator
LDSRVSKTVSLIFAIILDMNRQQLLEKLGFHPYEVSIYLAALELGEATVSDLAHKTEMPRTSVQEVLINMQKRGMVSSYSRQNHKFWIAENPEKLFVALKENEEAFKNILPELQALRPHSEGKPQVKVYSGVKEIKLIMDDMINTKHHILALISWDDWVEFFGKDYIEDYIERRRTHFLKIRIITPRTPLTEKLKSIDEKELRQTRFLSGDINLKRINNFIYGDKIAIISLNKKEPTGILIEDSDVVYGNTLYFENLWNSCNNK